MKAWLMAFVLMAGIAGTQTLALSKTDPSSALDSATLSVDPATLAAPERRAFIIPIRDDIMPPLTYVVRRGIKAAMDAKAELVVLDMDTNGGRVDVTEEIIAILGRFPGQTVTYVNTKAFSAGAFIAVATQRIFMAEEAVIGAAAPMMMVPGGGPASLPETVEAKMTSGIKALIRAKAEKNGHNVEVVEAMIDRQKELVIDGKVLNPKGQILTLTSSEAARVYGDPAKPLLSLGTRPSLDALLLELGYRPEQRVEIRPTGVELIATWLNAISPLLLALGAIGIYMEFKTPGFGVPGVVAIVALLLYFLGNYLAGLSGIEWIALFVLGVVLIGLEIFVFPGTLALGLSGALLLLIALVMATVDFYPGMPAFPSLPQLQLPMRNLTLAALMAALGIAVLGALLPRTPAYHTLVSQGTSGAALAEVQRREQSAQVGWEGVALSVLRPSGKVQFGEQVLDVITQGDLIDRGTRVRIVAHSGRDPVVERVA